MNAGQTCVAPDFVLVDRCVRDALVDALKRALYEFYGEAPQNSPGYGRIINRKHFDRLIGYLNAGQIAHGGQHDANDLYVAPTFLTDVRKDAPVMQEEIFGPILPVLEFTALDDALACCCATGRLLWRSTCSPRTARRRNACWPRRGQAGSASTTSSRT
jgi:aldehyde dehydrogenase (NAD+)